ncbi:MAG: molecular chaperone DnaJ [Sulfuricellaceae bacterium]|nr:molecular chaperone DnaJ [Sulfuricellaceae bacterium]
MTTKPLFDDENQPQDKTLSIATNQHQAPLSKGQKTFNSLIKQIEKKRAQLAEWEAAIAAYQQKHASEMMPLATKAVDLQVELVRKLDHAIGQKGLTKTERRMIRDLITELAGGLVGQRDDAELKAIYNKHSQSDYDSEEAAYMGGMKTMLEESLGFELGDDVDISSPEDVLQRLYAQFEAEQQAQEEGRAKKKKTAKQLAKEAKQEAEEKQTSLSIREVYRKLTSALHPDREPDPQERARKTALMQRANLAYEKNNLLQLLELQLELEHIDQAAINNLSEDRLKHYNKILREQLGELDQEIGYVEQGFIMTFNLSPFMNLSPGVIQRELAAGIVRVKHAIRDLKKDLLAFEDIKNLKSWLKNMRQQSAMDYFDDSSF